MRGPQRRAAPGAGFLWEQLFTDGVYSCRGEGQVIGEGEVDHRAALPEEVDRERLAAPVSLKRLFHRPKTVGSWAVGGAGVGLKVQLVPMALCDKLLNPGDEAGDTDLRDFIGERRVGEGGALLR